MKLTIHKINNKLHTMYGLRKLYPKKSLKELTEAMQTLPYIDSDIWHDESSIAEKLSGHCEFFYSRVPTDYGGAKCIPIWETQEYIDAENWYKALSEEDKKKVDVLRKGMAPYG